MKITIEGKKGKIYFKDIELGEVFQKDDVVYLRTQNLFAAGDYFNVVDIETGLMFYFEKDTKIDEVFTEMYIQ